MATTVLEHESRLLDALRMGDEEAFMAAMRAWGPGMLRLARSHVASDAVAEEVVQDAWVGILRGIDGFQARSSLRTWAFRIVASPAVDPDRFLPPDHERRPGEWALPPTPFPEERLVDAETLDVALRAIVSRSARPSPWSARLPRTGCRRGRPTHCSRSSATGRRPADAGSVLLRSHSMTIERSPTWTA